MTMTQNEAMRAIAERVNWQGDTGLRDDVLAAFEDAEPEPAGAQLFTDAGDAGASKADDTSEAEAPAPSPTLAASSPRRPRSTTATI